jgi:putative ABC transport system permease protein
MSNGVEDLQTMCVDLLFDPTVFLLAFLACFLLNLLSAAIPAWRITRTNVADAINER